MPGPTFWINVYEFTDGGQINGLVAHPTRESADISAKRSAGHLRRLYVIRVTQPKRRNP